MHIQSRVLYLPFIISHIFFLVSTVPPYSNKLVTKPKTWHIIAWNINKTIRYLLIFLPLGKRIARLLLMWKILWVNIVLLLKATGDFFKEFGADKEKRPVYIANIKKMSGLFQGHVPGINVIRESGSSAGTMCLRERYSPRQLPAWPAGTHQPNTQDWKRGWILEC